MSKRDSSIFDDCVQELERELWAGSAFEAWTPPENPYLDATGLYLLRIFFQKVLFAATKMDPGATGCANLWVCHSTENVPPHPLRSAGSTLDRPAYLRSEEREGFFNVGQLVQVQSVTRRVQYRANPTVFSRSLEELSVAAQALLKKRPIFHALSDSRGYDSEEEKKRNITHILGIPLLEIDDSRDNAIAIQDGCPLSITIDFRFPSDVTTGTKDRLEDDGGRIRSLVDRFRKDVWRGPWQFGSNYSSSQSSFGPEKIKPTAPAAAAMGEGAGLRVVVITTDKLWQRYKIPEIRTFLQRLSIDPNAIAPVGPDANQIEYARRMIEEVWRHGRLLQLIELLNDEAPAWTEELALELVSKLFERPDSPSVMEYGRRVIEQMGMDGQVQAFMRVLADGRAGSLALYVVRKLLEKRV
jgi:hypothetical protein